MGRHGKQSASRGVSLRGRGLRAQRCSGAARVERNETAGPNPPIPPSRGSDHSTDVNQSVQGHTHHPRTQQRVVDTLPSVATAKKPEQFHWSRDSRRVQPLGDTFVRVFDHKGKSWQIPSRAGHLSGLLDGIYEDDPECALRIAGELDSLAIEHGWSEPQPGGDGE